MNIGGCLCICHPRGDDVAIVSSHSITISCPEDSGGRTTSGGAGEGEHRRVNDGLYIKLKVDSA